jgi:hypothetical protein
MTVMNCYWHGSDGCDCKQPERAETTREEIVAALKVELAKLQADPRSIFYRPTLNKCAFCKVEFTWEDFTNHKTHPCHV